MVLHLKCGKPNCLCKKDENAKHGPYNVWTRKVKGKTVTKYLSEHQAELCGSGFRVEKEGDNEMIGKSTGEGNGLEINANNVRIDGRGNANNSNRKP